MDNFDRLPDVVLGGNVKPPASLPELQWTQLSRRHRTTWRNLSESDRVRFTFNGRAGIFQYLEMLRSNGAQEGKRFVLVPAFHCPTVVDPILHAGYDVRFYSVDDAMRVDAADFLSRL